MDLVDLFEGLPRGAPIQGGENSWRRTASGWLIAVAVCAVPSAGCLARAEEMPRAEEREAPEESVRPGLNDTFLSDDLDVGRFVKIFEGESREIYTQRRAIVQALRLTPGMAVADIGAGTGLFMAPLAKAVGSGGRVFEVDISPVFVEHLRARVRNENLGSVSVVLDSARSVELPEASIDQAFVCDTYHHFEFPLSTLASLRRAIRPGGSLVIVDFERIPGQSRDWVLEHMRAGKQVFTREIEQAGFELEKEIPIEGLKENYMLRFRRR